MSRLELFKNKPAYWVVVLSSVVLLCHLWLAGSNTESVDVILVVGVICYLLFSIYFLVTIFARKGFIRILSGILLLMCLFVVFLDGFYYALGKSLTF